MPAPTSSSSSPRPRLPKLRLFVDGVLDDSALVTLAREQTHYLVNVMRAEVGDEVALFNGRDGEWVSTVDTVGKRGAQLRLSRRLRAQSAEPDLWLAFAPIKRGRIDFVAAKATELGVSRLVPVVTAHTQMSRVNTDRLRANAVEAAEQCERMTVPDVAAPVSFAALLDGWPAERELFVGDETGHGRPIAAVAAGLAHDAAQPRAVLVGPEGGFSDAELDALDKLPFVTKFGLGPRIMRADTAAIAALAILQALAGDWQAPEQG